MKKYFPETMTVIFAACFVLKMTGFSISWWVVLAPIYVPTIVALVYFVNVACKAAIDATVEVKKDD